MNEFEELHGERDAAELAGVARALDVSGERAPRPAFLASLRGRLERESAARPARPRGFALSGLQLRWAASLAAVVVLAVASALSFPTPLPTMIGPGERLVVVSDLGFIAYDPRTLQERERVNVSASKPWVMLASDQRTLVFTFGNEFRKMRILDIRDPGGFREVLDLSSPHQFALSSDGSRAYVRDGQAIRVVDVEAARLIATIPTPGVEDSPVYLAPDDRRLFQFRPQGELVVFDVSERRELARMPVDLRDEAGLSASARVAISHDGTKLYVVGSRTGSPTGPVRVLVLDAATLATLADREVDVARAPRLSREDSPLARFGEWLASLGFVAEAKELGTVTQIALSPDDRLLYAARGSAGEGILLIDAERLESIGIIESGRSVFGVQLSPTGDRVYALAAAGGEAALVAVDARSYGAVATASIRRTAADTSVILYKP